MNKDIYTQILYHTEDHKLVKKFLLTSRIFHNQINLKSYQLFYLLKKCDYSINNAAKRGHLEVIKWLHYNRSEGCTTKALSLKAMDLAAENGHLEVVKWLHHNRSEGCTTDAMNRAAKYGHLEVVKFLKSIKKK